MKETPKHMTDASRNQPLDRWLKGDVAAAFDAMKADPARGVCVDDAFAAVRAHHAKRTKDQS